MANDSSEQPARKQSKWSAEEDALIIELRGKQMKWEDISKNLPGRSAISCRLHYQNYLERRSEWDEQRKDKLAQLYERFKSRMWAELAEELQVPWRAAEAMHWQLGEQEMARRAGTTPFTLAAVNAETAAASRQIEPSRSQQPHSHLQPQPPPQAQPQRHRSVPLELGAPNTHNMGTRSHLLPSGRPEQLLVPRQYTAPPPPPPRPAEHSEMSYQPPVIAPLHYPEQQPENGLSRQLPSIAELTTGVNPYHGQYSGQTPSHAPYNGTDRGPPHPPPYHRIGHEQGPPQRFSEGERGRPAPPSAYHGNEQGHATPGQSHVEATGIKRSASPDTPPFNKRRMA